MKQFAYVLTLGILASCGQSQTDKIEEKELSVKEETAKPIEIIAQNQSQSQTEAEADEELNYQNQTLAYEFKNAKLYQLSDTLIADFNGDENLDKAIFKKENGTSGIIIMHGITNETMRIGFGERFAHLTAFNWVDYWGLVKDSSTYEIVIEDAEIIGDTIVSLDNPSIVVRKEEAGGGLITFRNGKYEWIHQAD